MPWLFVYLYKNRTMQKVNFKISVITPLCVALYQFSSQQSNLCSQNLNNLIIIYTTLASKILNHQCVSIILYKFTRVKFTYTNSWNHFFFSKCKCNNMHVENKIQTEQQIRFYHNLNVCSAMILWPFINILITNEPWTEKKNIHQILHPPCISHQSSSLKRLSSAS